MVSVFWMVLVMDAWIASIALVGVAWIIWAREQSAKVARVESWNSIMRIQDVLR